MILDFSLIAAKDYTREISYLRSILGILLK